MNKAKFIPPGYHTTYYSIVITELKLNQTFSMQFYLISMLYTYYHLLLLTFLSIFAYRMSPSIEPVHTISSVSGTIQSIDRGCPGNLSDMLPQSPQVKMFNSPWPHPHTTFWPLYKDGQYMDGTLEWENIVGKVQKSSSIKTILCWDWSAIKTTLY